MTAGRANADRPTPRLTAVLLGLALTLFVASLALGPTGFGWPESATAAQLILIEVRLPRAVLAALVGAGLGLSGAAMQGYLRNPLAEPGLFGVTGGASLGAVLAIHSGAAASFALALPLAGLAGAAVATTLVIVLAGPRTSPLGLILAGVAVSSLTGALTTLALNLAPNPFASIEIVFWMLGSLTDRSLTHVWIAAPFILAGLAILLRTSADLDALTLGDDAAANLGVDLSRTRLQVVAGTAMAVGAATAVAGSIAFVGLVTPHLLRRHVGHHPSRLLGASALGGATLVLAGDIAVRLIAPYGDVRLGVLTALVGAPFFLWLILDLQREGER